MRQLLRSMRKIAIADHLENVRFADTSRGLLHKMRHKFAAADQAILFAVEKDDHDRANIMPSDEARTFEANRDSAGVVVGTRRTGHRIVVRSKEDKWAIVRPAGRDDDVVVVALKRRL